VTQEKKADKHFSPISSSARKHFVDTDNVERVHADTEVERIFSTSVDHVLSASHTCCLKRFTGELLTLVGHQMGYVRVRIDAGPLVANIINAKFWVWHTSKVTRLYVRLVLAIAVTFGWTSTHFQ
jgi:hypothetical protein